MTRQYVNVGNRKWGVLVYYDVRQHDLYEIADALRELGCDERDIRHAMEVLSRKNCAMTYSDFSSRMSLMAIAATTNEEELYNSIFHEVDHVCDHICDYYGVSYNSEDAAYLQGTIGGQILKFVINKSP